MDPTSEEEDAVEYRRHSVANSDEAEDEDAILSDQDLSTISPYGYDVRSRVCLYGRTAFGYDSDSKGWAKCGRIKGRKLCVSFEKKICGAARDSVILALGSGGFRSAMYVRRPDW